jgi:hypothetical protein
MASPTQFEDVRSTIFEEIEIPDIDRADRSYDRSDYRERVMALIEDADDYEESFLGPAREEAEEYYQGLRPYLNSEDVEDETEEAGRSTVVSTDVRDTIMAIMPSLIRIFTSGDHPVYFEPNNARVVEIADQQTDYIAHSFYEDNPGFMIIFNILKDSMNKSLAAVKWWTDKTAKVVVKNYSNVTPEQLEWLETQPDLVDIKITVEAEANSEETVFSVQTTQKTVSNALKIASIPPEEFRINRRAKSVDDATLVGHRRGVSMSDMIQMGYTKKQVENLMSAEPAARFNTDERFLRNPSLTDEYNAEDEIDFGEYWIKVDSDNDGIAELHYMHVVGEQIIRDELVDKVDMAIFCADPEPHTAVGNSINQNVQDIQRIKTNVLRSTLDSLAQSIHGRMGVVENLVNMDDVLNDDIGAPIRLKSPNALVPVPTTYVGQPALEMMGYLDALAQRRTGISEASKGLDPRALQSTNVNAVDMVIEGAKERIELIARILAETGMKDMYKGLLLEICANPPRRRILKIRGKFVEIDPEVFDPTLSVKTNPAIGRGTDLDRYNTLAGIVAKQEMILTNYGPMNPFVTPAEYTNAITDMLGIAGIKNVGRYFKNPTPQELQQFMASRDKPDPAMILANAEVKKADAKIEEIKADTIKTITSNSRQEEEFNRDDDFRRDKLEADTRINAAKLGIDAFDIINSLQIERKAAESAEATEVPTGPFGDTTSGA